MSSFQGLITIFDLYRFYVGSYPRIVIGDLNLLKEIMVKEFDTFTDRGYLVRWNGLKIHIAILLLFMAGSSSTYAQSTGVG